MHEEAILTTLQTVIDPYLGIEWVAAKTIKNIRITDSNEIHVDLKFNYPVEGLQTRVKALVLTALKNKFPTISSVFINITWTVNSHLAQKGLKSIPGIKNIIAIASGKGGVGKSTTAVNLALAMKAIGARVGILDADIYGPSQPLMLGIHERPTVIDNKRMKPIESHGLQSMSMGYLIEAESPMIWRGPMVSTALQQLLNETVWEELDYLIVDLPPGTGDIQLTLAQKIPVAGAVIVTTPQDIALLDARKALIMFKKLGITVLGVVENMSTHICRQCGYQEAIFGSEGGQKMAEQQEVPLLGQLPLDKYIREHTDEGKPTVISDPEGSIAKLYHDIAYRVTANLSLQPRDYTAAFSNLVIQN